jgi:hypothetical protein
LAMTAMPQVAVGLRAGTVVIIQSRRWSLPADGNSSARCEFAKPIPALHPRPLMAAVNHFASNTRVAAFRKAGQHANQLHLALPTIRRIRKVKDFTKS